MNWGKWLLCWWRGTHVFGFRRNGRDSCVRCGFTVQD